MTRKELVKLLTETYDEDDEVYVRYLDDQGECVEKVKGIGSVTQEHCHGHYEVRESDGSWRRLEPCEDAWGYSRSDIRYVVDSKSTSTRRCIIVD